MSFTCKTKLCSIVAFGIITLIGCGKKVKNTVPQSETQYSTTPALEISSITLEMEIHEENATETDVYEFQSNAWIKIPQANEIKIKSGAPEHYRTRIYFNSTQAQRLDGSAELYCEYSVTKLRGSDATQSEDGYKYLFKGCYEDVDYDGIPDPMSYSPGTEVVQDSGKQVRFEFEYGFANDPAEIYTDLKITDWF